MFGQEQREYSRKSWLLSWLVWAFAVLDAHGLFQLLTAEERKTCSEADESFFYISAGRVWSNCLECASPIPWKFSASNEPAATSGKCRIVPQSPGKILANFIPLKEAHLNSAAPLSLPAILGDILCYGRPAVNGAVSSGLSSARTRCIDISRIRPATVFTAYVNSVC